MTFLGISALISCAFLKKLNFQQFWSGDKWQAKRGWNLDIFYLQYTENQQSCLYMKFLSLNVTCSIYNKCMLYKTGASITSAQAYAVRARLRQVQFTVNIEGLHDAVRTYERTTFQNLLVSFCTAWYEEKQQKNARTFDLLHGRIWNFIRVCVLIFLSLGSNLVIWYELNKK